jgi:hypothetical protein
VVGKGVAQGEGRGASHRQECGGGVHVERQEEEERLLVEHPREKGCGLIEEFRGLLRIEVSGGPAEIQRGRPGQGQLEHHPQHQVVTLSGKKHDQRATPQHPCRMQDSEKGPVTLPALAYALSQQH